MQALAIRAEACRQSERWDEALALASACLALQPRVSKKARKGGHLHFAQLALCYAHLARGSPAACKQALAQLAQMPTDYAFRRAVDFKAAHLCRQTGLDLG